MRATCNHVTNPHVPCTGRRWTRASPPIMGRYYKLLEEKEIPYLISLVSKPAFMLDPTLACIYETTLELGQEAFDQIPRLSITSRKLLYQFYSDPAELEVQPFKELFKNARRGYLNVTGTARSWSTSSPSARTTATSSPSWKRGGRDR